MPGLIQLYEHVTLWLVVADAPDEAAARRVRAREPFKVHWAAVLHIHTLRRTDDYRQREKDNAESLGLITTELVINSLKHAFNDDSKGGRIVVAFDVSGTDWRLSVADNGVGKPDGVFAQAKSGLGTGIITALAKQLDAKLDTESGPAGTTVSVTHATFPNQAHAA